jgi:hypothetical protein
MKIGVTLLFFHRCFVDGFCMKIDVLWTDIMVILCLLQLLFLLGINSEKSTHPRPHPSKQVHTCTQVIKTQPAAGSMGCGVSP